MIQLTCFIFRHGDEKTMKKASLLLSEFSPRRLIPNVLAGIIIGTLTVIVEISFGALIFSGPLSVYVFNGIGCTLFGAFVISGAVALTSSFPGTIARPHEIPAAILAIIVASIAASMPAASASQDTFITVLAAIILTSVLTGVFFLALGSFKLGSLIRFIPFPVVGGFLAGTGWLLGKGGINVITNVKLSAATAHLLFQPDVLVKWIPALVFAVILMAVMKRFTHFLVMPLMILSAAVVFYAVLFSTGTSIVSAQSHGWLLGPFQQGNMWKPPALSEINHIHWGLIFTQFTDIGTILIISVLPLLLNASGFELMVRKDLDFNRELKSAGIANVLAGFGGGTVGFHSLSLSALGFRMGATSRLAGLSCAALCGATLFFGSSLLTYFPRPILGGLLLYLGLGFLVEWVYDAFFKLPKIDYLLILLILLVIGMFGFLQGVATGILVAVALFVINYSRIRVVKFSLSGVNYHSNVDRGLEMQRLLMTHGEQLAIFKLQGYVFFGTANNLLTIVRARIDDPALPKARFLVLDFSLVSGLDTSALKSFTKMLQVAEAQGATVVLTTMSTDARRRFERGSISETSSKSLRIFPDLDHGVEWCEDRIVAELGHTAPVQKSLPGMLSELLPPGSDISRFSKHLDFRTIPRGEYLMRQGEEVQSLYFIESGRVTAQLELDNGKTARLRTMGAGTVVGELGMYLDTRATASVVAEEESRICGLSLAALRDLEQADPLVAAAFHKFIVRLLGERLTNANRSLSALLT
jgi:sulfate permease, SulP family